MFRSMTSYVSALSGIVANGHQTVHSVSSAPSKIPYGGFSPVRLQTRPQDVTFARVSARVYRRLPSISGIHPLLCPVHWTCVPSERAGHRFRPSGPVALGSASGYSVRRPLRLLWPHPSFCAAPPVSLYFRRTWRVAEGPHFYLPRLADVPPSLPRWFRGTPTNPSLGLAFAKSEEARQPYDPHTGSRVADLTRLQRSLNAAARQLACPAPDRTFTTELACAKSPRRKSVITTGTFVSSLTGLSPAALAALWAALRPDPG